MGHCIFKLHSILHAEYIGKFFNRNNNH